VTAADARRGALRAWLGDRLGDPDLAITDFVRHSEGFSWETYTLDASWRDRETATVRNDGFAIRVQPRDGLLAPYDIEAQYRLNVALAETAVPVPVPLWLELDEQPLGMPFYVMDRVRGSVPVQWRPDDTAIFPTPEAVHRFGERFADLQAEIHRVDWRAAGLAGLLAADDPIAASRAQLARWTNLYEQSTDTEIPVFREAVEWLASNLRPSGDLVLCHGDYRIGNVMEAGGDVVAVLDWELAHIGDPIEDLAYTGLPLWRGRDTRISHFLEPSEYFGRYEAATGTAVDPAAYGAWTVFGLLKAGACHLRGAQAFAEGRSNDVRLAAMGHQVHHVARHLRSALGL
jgi:aminoglycoside phosphotransferase (APT) family kinase protein